MRTFAMLMVAAALGATAASALAQDTSLPSLPPSQPTSPPAAPPPAAPPPAAPSEAPPPLAPPALLPPSGPVMIDPLELRHPCAGRGAFEHDGFYLRISGGAGGTSLQGTGPAGKVVFGGLASTGMLAVGGTPARGLVLGGMVAGGTVSGVDLGGAPVNQVHGWDGMATSLSAFVDWFPRPADGWHAGGSLGLGIVDLKSTALQVDWTGLSLGGGVFGGYDFWIGPQWSLGLQANFGIVGRADLKDGSGNDSGYALGGFWGGLEGTLLHH